MCTRANIPTLDLIHCQSQQPHRGQIPEKQIITTPAGPHLCCNEGGATIYPDLGGVVYLYWKIGKLYQALLENA